MLEVHTQKPTKVIIISIAEISLKIIHRQSEFPKIK
jgi:hypothetical protein